MTPPRHTLPTRRRVLKTALSLGAASSIFGASRAARLLAQQGSQAALRPVVFNKKPLSPNAFYPLPLGSVKPTGWLQQQLRIQADGLSGHLDETWPDVGPNSGWLGGTGESWERGPYYLDGLIPLAYLLDDPSLKAKAQRYIDWTLRSQDASGMFGPRTNNDWWPRIVMLKALAQYEEATGDPRVLPFMHRYMLYQLSQLPTRPLRDWGKFRWQDQLLTVLWVYNRTGDAKLLELANLLHTQGYDWIGEFKNFPYKEKITAERIGLAKGQGMHDLALATHGVNNGQAIKTGPVWSVVSGSREDREAVLQMISELNRYHGLPNGMFSCDEHLAGPDPSQGSELCTVVEYMFSLEQSLAILGDPTLGDRLEQLAFNALPGTLTDDMWAHQYNQEPNQVEASLHKKPWVTDGPESNLFGLEPNFGCCTANYHQGWPKFTSSLFMASPDDGLAAVAYAPCSAEILIRNTPVQVVSETSYPFHGSVTLTVNPQQAISFPLSLRIPAWAAGASIRVNGAPQAPPAPGTFARIERRWKPGDRVEITFPLEPRLTTWFHNSVAVERGPLVFSLPIGEDWLKLADRGLTADWQIYPSSPWNYALALNPGTPATSIEVSATPLRPMPFSLKGNPVTLRLRGRKLPAWRAVDGVAGPLPQSPVDSASPDETLTLVPYAGAKLRITAFPCLKA